MQKVDGLRVRQNTFNTHYGYDQMLEEDNDFVLDQPNGMGVTRNVNGGIYDPSLDGPNEYQFAVAGNVGALKQPVNMHKKGTLTYQKNVLSEVEKAILAKFRKQ